ncbi:MAG: hypothetical protein IPK16_02275 [Anaerolineales bacterium]|nr:hypothetical protein [Anaerolineales bacterium]
MTPLQRALLAIDHLQPDRIPVIPQTHIWASYNYGSSSDELMYDGRRYAEIQIQAQRDFGWDGIFVATDSCALAHSLGLEVLATDLGVAPSPEGILKSLDDADKLELIDPRTTRLNEWITATRLLVEALGDQVLIVACADQGAFSLAAQLRGMQDFLLDVGYGVHEAQIHQLLTFCNQYILQFAECLMAAGAHVVTIGDALASGSLISPKTYARYAFPYHQALAAAIRERGGRLSIHVCGKTTHVIERLANTGAHIVEFDSMTDFDVALAAAAARPVCSAMWMYPR